MKGDFSRIRFNRKKNYTAVLQQQGRVALDADANEQRAIDNFLRDTQTIDFVGRCGYPNTENRSFKIWVNAQGTGLEIGPGRYYVDGLLCENPETVPYTPQPFLINPAETDETLLANLTQDPTQVILVYLEVWQQLVTALDDPCLAEPALGQADTTARLQTVWRVRAVSRGSMGVKNARPLNQVQSSVAGKAFVPVRNFTRSGLTFTFPQPQPVTQGSGAPSKTLEDCCAAMRQSFAGMPRPTGRMAALTGAGGEDCSCQPTPAAGYIGLENQLYRVEIHQGGDETQATFKWSRENASVVVGVTQAPSGKNVTVDSLGPDANLGFSPNQWVEIYDDSRLFGDQPNQPGNLYQIQSVTPETLTLTMTDTVAPVDPTMYARMRRWDQFGSTVGNEGISLPVTSSYPLENGISVQFKPGQYEPGDYWLIPARTAIGNIEWPPCDSDGSTFQPPHRVPIFRAPLACIEWQNGDFFVEDCRDPFDNLVDLTKRPQGCCTVMAGPEDLTGSVSLQSIIDKAAAPTMFVKAASPGISGNNITVQIYNLRQTLGTPTFDVTVRETAVYRGLTVGGSTGIEGVIGDEESNLPNTGPLAHILVGSVNIKGTPADNQTITLSSGGTGAAQGDIVDSNKKLVFTLQARSAGVDGNLTSAKITNLDTSLSSPTFDLNLAWSKTLRGLSMATLIQEIQSNLSYEIVAQPPTTVNAVPPADGVTTLSGGSEGNSKTGSSAVPAQAGIFGNPAKVCLRPGTYYFAAPLVLGPEHSNITIESCGSGQAILSALSRVPGPADPTQGLMELNSASNVALSGLRFSLPFPMRLVVGRDFLTHLDPKVLAGMVANVVQGGADQVTKILGGLAGSVGIRPVGCTNLRVENCTFDFETELGSNLRGAVLQAGILAGGENSRLTLVNNHFEGQAYPVMTSDNSLQVRVGYLLAPSVDITKPAGGQQKRVVGRRLVRAANSPAPPSVLKTQPPPTDVAVTAQVNEQREAGTVTPASLQDACIRGNVFEGLEAPVLVFSECGSIALEDNTIRDCYSGPWIIARRSPPDVAKVAGGSEQVTDVRMDPVFVCALALALCYPLPQGFSDPQALTIPPTTVVLKGGAFQNPVLALLNALLELAFGLLQAASQLISATELDLYLHCSDNKIATYTPPLGADATGPGLVIWGEDADFNTEVILNSNRIENLSAPLTPTAVIVQIQNCSLNANLIFNDSNSTMAGSLYLSPLSTLSPPFAVTGNIFNSNTNLASLVSQAFQTVGTGNSNNTVFNGTLGFHPIQGSSVKVFAGASQVGTDNSAGSITGAGLQGTVDYMSGMISLTFTSAPASGTPVNVSYFYSKWVPLNGP